MLPILLNGRRGEKTPLDTPLTSEEEGEALLGFYERVDDESKLTSETYKVLTQGRLTGNLQAQRRSKRRARKKKKKTKNKGRKQKNDEDINGQKAKRRRSKKGQQLEGANTVNSTTDLTDVQDLRDGAPAFNVSQNMNCSEMKTMLQTLRESKGALKKQIVAQCPQTATGDRPQAPKFRRGRERGKKNKVKKHKAKKNKIRWKRQAEGDGVVEEETEGLDTSIGKISNEDMTETTEEQQDFEDSNPTETQTNICGLQLNEKVAAVREKTQKVRREWKSKCKGTSGTENENSGDDSKQGKKKKNRRRKKKNNEKGKKKKNERMDQEEDTTEDSGGQDYPSWNDA